MYIKLQYSAIYVTVVYNRKDIDIYTVIMYNHDNTLIQEKIMTGIYFSGTGNSEYAARMFTKEFSDDPAVFSIEDRDAAEKLKEADEIVLSYPVQYSSIPKILYDFIAGNADIWQGKRVFIIATMAMFSGDGAGVAARLLSTYGAEITGGLHLVMPDSIADEKVLKRPFEKNRQLVRDAAEKIKKAAEDIKQGRYPKEGLNAFSRFAGFVTQRAWFGYKTRSYTDKLKTDNDKCVGCAKCVKLCPTGNIFMEDRKARGKDRCTLCYRCVNSCPKQALTILGKSVIGQTSIEKYI